MSASAGSGTSTSGSGTSTTTPAVATPVANDLIVSLAKSVLVNSGSADSAWVTRGTQVRRSFRSLASSV